MIIITDELINSNPELSLDNPVIGWHTWTRTGPGVIATPGTSSSVESAPLRPDTYEYWQPASMPAVWSVIFSETRTVNYVAMAGNTFGRSFNNVRVEYTNDPNAGWSTFAEADFGFVNSPVMFMSVQTTAVFWRIVVDGEFRPRMAVFYAGLLYTLPHRIYGGHSPSSLSRKTKLSQNMSRGGQFLGQTIRQEGVETSVSLRHLDPDWYRDSFDLFVRSFRRYPCFFGWRPLSYPGDLIYGWNAGGDIRPTNMGVGKGLMEVSFSIRGQGPEAAL